MRFKRAQILAWKGTYPAAAREYEALRSEFPENVDYAFGYAQVLALQGDDKDALNVLRRATKLAPGYEDVWRLYHQLLSQESDDNSSAELSLARSEIARRFPNADWRHEAPRTESPDWIVLAGGSVEHLSDGLPGWNSQFAQLNYAHSNLRQIFVRSAREERFDKTDIQLALGIDWKLPQKWLGGGGVAMVSDANFLPELQYELHLGRSLARGWAFDIRYRRRNYQTAVVDSYIGLVERYVGDFRVALSTGLSHPHGAGNSLAQTVYFNWYATETTALGLSFAYGEEAEAIGAGQILETKVQGITLTGRHKLHRRLTLDWSLGAHEQGDFYRRQYAGVAVSVGI